MPQGYLEGPAREAEPISNVRAILSVLFKWKWLIVGAFLAIFVPVAVLSLFKPTTYRAKATVMVKQERTYLAISPGASERAIVYPVSRQTINSEMQIIKSREVMDRVVKELDLGPKDAAAQKPDMPAGDQAVFALQSAILVTPIPDSSMIEITYMSGNPEKAVKVVNKIAEVYRERHAAINRPDGAYGFFETQANVYSQKLKEAQTEMKGFETREGIIDADKELAQTIDRVAQLERDLRSTETETGEVRTRIAFLRAEIKRQPEKVTTEQDTVLNRSALDLRQRLINLELEKKALLQLYTEKDRRVTAKQEEIEAVRATLAKEDTHTLGRESTVLNPIRRSLEQEHLTAQGRAESLSAKQQTLNRQLAAARAHMSLLNQKSSEFQRLKQAVQINQQNQTVYQKKSEEARISEAMDRENLLNVAIAERAALPLRPMSSGVPVALMLAAFTGIAVGVGGAFGIEFFNSSFKTEREVEEQLGLPVLATIEHFQA
jgi:uncharacterized protein involved in exopolysaccharide biosynthesis